MSELAESTGEKDLKCIICSSNNDALSLSNEQKCLMQMAVCMKDTIICHTWAFLRDLYTIKLGGSGDVNFLTKVLKFSPEEQRV